MAFDTFVKTNKVFGFVHVGKKISKIFFYSHTGNEVKHSDKNCV